MLANLASDRHTLTLIRASRNRGHKVAREHSTAPSQKNRTEGASFRNGFDGSRTGEEMYFIKYHRNPLGNRQFDPIPSPRSY